jgi:hypothetical protein
VHNLPCGHTFHNVCINQWFTQKQIRHELLQCPICRVRIMLGGSNSFYNKFQKYINKNFNL